MPVAVVMRFEGATLEHYDKTNAELGYHTGEVGPPGLLFHWGTATETGILVTDVWETRDDFDRFSREQVAPATQRAGVPGMPEITFHDVHTYLLGNPR